MGCRLPCDSAVRLQRGQWILLCIGCERNRWQKQGSNQGCNYDLLFCVVFLQKSSGTGYMLASNYKDRWCCIVKEGYASIMGQVLYGCQRLGFGTGRR